MAITVSRNTLSLVYAMLAVCGFAAALTAVFAYGHLGPADATLKFWEDTLANPATRFITVDIFLFALTVFIWMLMEARRLGLGTAWSLLYVSVAVFFGISFAMPVFMLHRQRILLAKEPASSAGVLHLSDMFVLVGTAVMVAGYAVKAFL